MTHLLIDEPAFRVYDISHGAPRPVRTHLPRLAARHRAFWPGASGERHVCCL